jgi:hypothetical protein
VVKQAGDNKKKMISYETGLGFVQCIVSAWVTKAGWHCFLDLLCGFGSYNAAGYHVNRGANL